MFKTVLLGIGGLAAAALLPYALSTAPSHFSALRQWIASDGPDQSPAEIAAQSIEPPELLPAATPVVPPEGWPVRNVAEVLRFDVTPDWIMRRWPRVSSGLADLQLHGYRVPLVTGTNETDLAGSLTYYFNPQQRVQRITFAGSTGNVSQLVGVLASQFRMARRITNDPSLMIYESASKDGRPASQARIRSMPVIDAANAFRRYEVELVLERPAA